MVVVVVGGLRILRGVANLNLPLGEKVLAHSEKVLAHSSEVLHGSSSIAGLDNDRRNSVLGVDGARCSAYCHARHARPQIGFACKRSRNCLAER